MIITLGDYDLYRKFSYPAGELQVRFEGFDIIAKVNDALRIDVVARITKSEQIIELRLLLDAILGIIDPHKAVTLILPYLPYSRADRRFHDGDCLGIGVFADLLGNVPARIVTLDAHSEAAHQWFGNLIDVSAGPFIEQAIRQFAIDTDQSNVNILFPDEGARQRYRVPADIPSGDRRIRVSTFHAKKVRDPLTGKLSGFEVPGPEELGDVNPVLIIDDICDGGGTFLGIAGQLGWHENFKGLYVTHGIFSKGFAELHKEFSFLYSTDSFKKIGTFYSSDPSGAQPTGIMIFPCLEEILDAIG